MSLFKSHNEKQRQNLELLEAYQAREQELKPLSDMQVLMVAVAEIYQATEGCLDDALFDSLLARSGTGWDETERPE